MAPVLFIWKNTDLSTELLMGALLASKCLGLAGVLARPMLRKLAVDTLMTPMSDTSSMPTCLWVHCVCLTCCSADQRLVGLVALYVVADFVLDHVGAHFSTVSEADVSTNI